MTRDEDKFFKSFVAQVEEVKENWLFNLIKMISPTGWSLQIFYGHCSKLYSLSHQTHIVILKSCFHIITNDFLLKTSSRYIF